MLYASNSFVDQSLPNFAERIKLAIMKRGVEGNNSNSESLHHVMLITSMGHINYTGSITPFWIGQKANIIVTLVEIMITFCILQNVIRILILVSLLGGSQMLIKI